jgi:hypothetical protein
MRRAALVVCAALTAGSVFAQEAPPDTTPPPGPVDPEAPPPHSAALQQALAPPRLATAQPSAELPAGTIRVTVRDGAGELVAGAAVNVGSLAQGERDRYNGESDGQGRAVFEDLPTGQGQAYRVNVPYDGATYRTDPFQLPPDRGYEVEIRRLPTTRDDARVLQIMGQTIVEIRGERLHLIHQAQLANFGQETFVFPDRGVRFDLPEGYLVFQGQRVISDQRFQEIEGEGFFLQGSLPPGRVDLAWGYDLPIEGGTMEIGVDLPFRTISYRVISQAPEGLELGIDGMPRPERIDNDGQALWLSMVRRQPSDPALERITLRVRGIPGPGVGRVVASVIALLFAALGIVLAIRRQGAAGTTGDAEAFAARRAALLAEAEELAEDRRAGDVGPEFFAERRRELERDMAELLYLEERGRD